MSKYFFFDKKRRNKEKRPHFYEVVTFSEVFCHGD